jgi:phytoene dehydrogenase-like protein
MKIAVVGAGLAGLTCAKILHEGGRDVTVFEASDGVGGRVRSDLQDGFWLDRGFQVLFTAYPAAKRRLNYDELKLRYFEPGAIIAKNGKRTILTDPFRDFGGALPAALSNAVTFTDKIKTLQLSLELKAKKIAEIRQGEDDTTLNYLKKKHFSDKFINNFIRPFYGGIFLDRSLTTSAKAFKYDFKMLSEGETAIPAGGMGMISQQLAEPLLKAKRIRLNSAVRRLIRNNGTVRGVQLDGETFEADIVILATAAPEASHLSGLPTVEGKVSTANLYYSTTQSIYHSKKIVLNADSDAFVNNAVQISNIAPEYSPPGYHLLSATVIGIPALNDDLLLQKGLDDLRRMFAHDNTALTALNTAKGLAVKRLPYAQFSQPPGIHPRLPSNKTDLEGLYFAAEFTEASSINAAIISGEKAARLIMHA